VAARTFSPKHDEQTRLKIKTSQLLNRLNALIAGEIEMPPHAVTAALGLLRKVLPDLSAQELSGGVTNYVARLPTPAKDVSAWEDSLTTPQKATQGAKPKATTAH
jgi:hypothetical protein